MLILFTIFIILFFIILTATTQNMLFLGIALLIFGVLFFYLKGMAADPRAILIMGVYCVVWGIMTVVASITHSGLEIWVFADGCGFIILWGGIYLGIIEVILCKEKVSAVYMGAKLYTTKRSGHYAPFFSYIYQGRQYKNSAIETTYRKRKLDKRYQEGNCYTIYLNPRNPNLIRTKRYPQIKYIWMLFIGVICISIPFFL